MSEYTVSHEDQQLGSFDVSRLEEGLKTGIFKSDDWVRWAGMPERVPLTASLHRLFVFTRQQPDAGRNATFCWLYSAMCG